MQVKFSHMAKISKIIITGRNEVNVNLQKQKHTCQLMTHTHKYSSLNHTSRCSHNLLCHQASPLMKEPVIFPLTLHNTFRSHYQLYLLNTLYDALVLQAMMMCSNLMVSTSTIWTGSLHKCQMCINACISLHARLGWVVWVQAPPEKLDPLRYCF